MIGPFLMRVLRGFFRFLLWTVLLCLAGLALLRLGVWITGSAQLTRDVLEPPQVTTWQVDHPDFGGLSALIMAPDGRALVAGSDRGTLIEAPLTRGSAGELTGFGQAVLTPVMLRSGQPPTDFKMDLEALTRDPEGGWFTAFESYVRIERLAGAGALPRATHDWDLFAALFGNQAFEALATLPDRRMIAITETGAPAASVIWDGETWQRGPEIPVTPGYRITGADVGPDGCFYLIERRYGIAAGFTFGLRRLSGGPGVWDDTLLYRTAPARLGNAEGLSVWENTAGQLMASVITDDGFWPLTPTRLIEFRLRPKVGCEVAF